MCVLDESLRHLSSKRYVRNRRGYLRARSIGESYDRGLDGENNDCGRTKTLVTASSPSPIPPVEEL